MKSIRVHMALLLTLVMLAKTSVALHIIVTFPSLKEDVSLIACPGDIVESIVPPGVDPHSYQLTPRDVEKLVKADLIVSTGHTPFELRIEELVKQGSIKARLLVIPEIPGLRLARNPVTGSLNMHMPIYDARNYRVFLKVLAETLSELNPAQQSCYFSKLKAILEKLDKLVEETRKVEAVAVGDLPFTQYAVAWLGLRVEALVQPEPGVPTTPSIIAKAEHLFAHGAWAVVTTPDVAPASKLLERLASKYNAPIVYVPSPLTQEPILEKLAYIARQIPRPARPGKAHVIPRELAWYACIAAVSTAFGMLSAAIAARRFYFIAAGLPHSSLLAALLAIPLAHVTGVPELFLATLISVLTILALNQLIESGVEPDVAASIYVSATASASVAAMYYVLTNYPLRSDIWAYIIGDPLLIDPATLKATIATALIAAIALVLTYREQVCLGFDPFSARLAGLKVRLYDILLLATLAASTVVMLKAVGFVIEHVLLLIPGAVAITVSRGMWRVLTTSTLVSLAAGLGGLTLALITGLSPAALMGLLAVIVYITALIKRRR